MRLTLKQGITIFLVFGACLLGFFIPLTIYQEHKYKAEIAFLLDCNSYSKIEKIRVDNFYGYEDRNFEYVDSEQIKTIMLSICHAEKPDLVSHRGSGADHTCWLHIIPNEGHMISLVLSKYDEKAVNFSYSPENAIVLQKKSEGLAFLFKGISPNSGE